ncbi:MAG: beta-galactosidase trimerization domain-containing protein [Thermoguttaceae bacterium]
MPEIDLGGWPGLGNPHTLSVTPRADIFPGLKSFLDFVVDHRQWFATQQPHNEVALVYSIPSFLWNDVPLWQKYPHDHQVAFMAFGRAMEEGHVPYDVVIFGHPRLWDDTRSMARLAAYRTIIFPRVDCVSKSQWQAVNRFVRAGGRLVVGGNLPETANRDENFNPRTGGNPQTLAKQPGQGAVATVPMDILQQFYKSAIENATYAPTLRQSILKPLGANSLLRTDAPAEVGINVFTAANIWILHLVNHQYQAGSDSIPPVDGFSISLRLPPTVTIRKASWFDASDNVAHDLDITHSGEYEVFRPPPLKVWDLIVLE